MFVPVFGRWAVTLFALSLGIGCLGAAVEIALNAGYVLAQAFGWTWGADKRRRDDRPLRSRSPACWRSRRPSRCSGSIHCG